MDPKTKDLWVFVETKEDGSARNVGIELLNPGKELAAKQGGKLVAVVIGNNVQAAVDDSIDEQTKSIRNYVDDSAKASMGSIKTLSIVNIVVSVITLAAIVLKTLGVF